MTWRTRHIALLLQLAFVGVAVNGTSDPSVFSVSTFPEDGGFPLDFLSGDGEVGNINDGETYLTDISPAEAIQLNLAKADLQSLASDLNGTVEEELEALQGDIFSSIDDFKERLENATQRMVFNLQCKFTRRFEQSDQIMTKIFSLSPFDIEIIKAELQNNISIVPIDFENATTPSPPTTIIQPEDLPKDCAEALDMELPSGVTTIRPANNQLPQRVWCDQETDGGGWTVMLRREPRPIQQDFRKNWDTYVEGFGDPRTEHWIGLETLHQLTKRNPYMLRVDMKTEEDGEEAFSIYNTFRVSAASRKYKLRVGDYNESSTGGDALIYHSGQKFTTYDEDNDGASGGSCAEWSGEGGWWYDYCFQTNPTGIYPPLNVTIGTDTYLEWREWRGFYFYLSHLVMMIRPRP